jgi:monofunctional biosynthetic peptidoglycan transglycosylase
MSRTRAIGRWVMLALVAGFWFLAYVYLTLPDVRPLATTNPASTAFIARRVREARSEGRPFTVRQRWVPYARISAQLKRAVLVAEDSAFWQHEGLDFDQIKESLEVNLERMEFVRGASTITQQLAKNLYLSPSKNPVRKLREVMITRRLEAELPKRRILEIYLNVIEWGDGIFGAEAAARAYFSTSAAGLGAEQSALLAGAIVNPRLLNPGHPTPRLRRRQRMILGRMGHVVPPPDVSPAAGPEPAGPSPEAAPAPPPAAIEPPATPAPSPEGGPGGDAGRGPG